MSDMPIRDLSREHLRALEGADRANGADDGARRGAGEEGDDSFGQLLGKMVRDVNEMQGQAAESVEALARGEVQDLSQVMVKMNKAEIGFKFMMEVRNKLVEAYQEVSRMNF